MPRNTHQRRNGRNLAFGHPGFGVRLRYADNDSNCECLKYFPNGHCSRNKVIDRNDVGELYRCSVRHRHRLLRHSNIARRFRCHYATTGSGRQRADISVDGYHLLRVCGKPEPDYVRWPGIDQSVIDPRIIRYTQYQCERARRNCAGQLQLLGGSLLWRGYLKFRFDIRSNWGLFGAGERGRPGEADPGCYANHSNRNRKPEQRVGVQSLRGGFVVGRQHRLWTGHVFAGESSANRSNHWMYFRDFVWFSFSARQNGRNRPFLLFRHQRAFVQRDSLGGPAKRISSLYVRKLPPRSDRRTHACSLGKLGHDYVERHGHGIRHQPVPYSFCAGFNNRLSVLANAGSLAAEHLHRDVRLPEHLSRSTGYADNCHQLE